VLGIIHPRDGRNSPGDLSHEEERDDTEDNAGNAARPPDREAGAAGRAAVLRPGIWRQYEAIAALRNRFQYGVPVVTQSPPDLVNALDKAVVSYREVRPYLRYKFVLGDKLMSVTNQVAQHRKTLPPESNRFPGRVQKQLLIEV